MKGKKSRASCPLPNLHMQDTSTHTHTRISKYNKNFNLCLQNKKIAIFRLRTRSVANVMTINLKEQIHSTNVRPHCEQIPSRKYTDETGIKSSTLCTKYVTLHTKIF